MAPAAKYSKDDAKPAAPMEGGARVEAVTVTPVDAGVTDGIEVIVTRPGTLGVLGIVPEGAELTVPEAQYSQAWMRPATREAAARAAKILKARKG